MTNATAYHPDPEINAEIAMQALEAERFDLGAGYLPRRWICPCGASHERGHFMTIGVHRCLRCGYVGEGGVVVDRVGEEGEFPA
jgi:hypothetical protein